MIKRKLVRIRLVNGYYSFGLINDKTYVTFFDFITKDENYDYKKIINKPVLFTNAVVYKQALKTNDWELLGEIEVSDSLLEKRPYYIQDIINKELFFIAYPPKYDEMNKTSKENCLGLELMTVSYPEHVIDRLNHHFFNTELKWGSSLPFWLIEKLNDEKNS